MSHAERQVPFGDKRLWLAQNPYAARPAGVERLTISGLTHAQVVAGLLGRIVGCPMTVLAAGAVVTDHARLASPAPSSRQPA